MDTRKRGRPEAGFSVNGGVKKSKSGLWSSLSSNLCIGWVRNLSCISCSVWFQRKHEIFILCTVRNEKFRSFVYFLLGFDFLFIRT